jgi:hypothetical protein
MVRYANVLIIRGSIDSCDGQLIPLGRRGREITANGYYQIPLSPSSQHLTVFMTPWGRYKYLRAPMGLCSSSDEYNRRADLAFEDVSNTKRVVDDLLSFDNSFPEHVAGV